MTTKTPVKDKPTLEKSPGNQSMKGTNGHSVPNDCNDEIRGLVLNEVGEEAFRFFLEHVPLKADQCVTISTTTKFNIDKIPRGKHRNIINLKRINDIRYINKFFESVNSKLPNGGIYINSVETYITRKSRVLKRFTFPLNWMIYTFDVFISRVLPKIPFTKKIYFLITKGYGRVLSKAETFGRLYSCGFEIVDERLINNEIYFVARKVKEPVFDNNPTYGPLIRLRRYGKDGKLFNVYKLRTMHAYSEYLQQYIYERNSLDTGGKFKDDFRVTTEGRFFRKFWLDELPMLINVLKGQLKIVGVRPLSHHYFSLYTEELREKRNKHKPGLVPPFYADLPKTLDEIMASEMRYLEAHEKHPFRTDIRYFFKAMYNIFIKRARSN